MTFDLVSLSILLMGLGIAAGGIAALLARRDDE